ncbi:MAG: hypothetical protein U0002_00455 [Thermoanaerobaculia bacterium]
MVRIGSSTEPDEAARALRELGGEIDSAGPEVVLARLPARALLQAAELPFVRSLEAPRRLQPLRPGVGG